MSDEDKKKKSKAEEAEEKKKASTADESDEDESNEDESEEEESDEEESEEEEKPAKAAKDKPAEKKAVKKKADKPAEKKAAEKPAPKASAPMPYALNEKWSGLWKVFAGVGAVGVIGAIAGYATNPERFAYSWLFGFLVALTFGIGSMMWVLIQYLTSAGWSVTVRRTAEFFASGSVVFIALVIPVILSMNTLFAGWLHIGEHHEGKPEASLSDTSHGALAMNDRGQTKGGPEAIPTPVVADHAAPAKAGPAAKHGDPEEVVEEQAIEHKTWWLTKNFFLVRAAIYVLFWMFLGTWLLRRSTMQDTTKDPKLTLQTAGLAPIMTILLAFTLTGGAFDWIMSLEPTWYSTIFGVNFFASSFVAIHSVLIITLFQMRQDGMLKKEVNVEHFHDLGKLQFGFLVFWAYISFSQFMLIWYAAIPEEVTWYHHRWDVGPWAFISMALLLLHFVLPFFLIISRNIKRKIELLRIGAMIILAMHVVELYWFVMPNLPKQEDFAFSWIDVVCLIGPVGVYLAVVFRNMASHPIIPVGDPRLSRALKFVNQ